MPALLLSGCGGAQPPVANLGVTAQTVKTMEHRNDEQSWIRPNATSSALLYLSDSGRDTIDIYDFHAPHNGLIGQLKGFKTPGGECSDTAGNVYITDDINSNNVLEFAHGSKKLTRVLSVNAYPDGCSVDPTTGNLAVSANGGTSGSDTGI
jgi:hypothetical protein